jgi:XRE family aerobic/anaerobic benzoate catabolism transcriptional regulator
MSGSTTDTPVEIDPERQFLKALGLRVRRRREASGYTRKALAQHAGLSERYLAQLELGSGNVSMLLLRKLAVALECDLVDLIEQGKMSRPPERAGVARINTILRQLGDDQLDEVADMLDARYGESTVMRQSRIALIGLRGAGKSTIGAMLAESLDMKFIELDSEIEREVGTDLSGIFSLYGQDTYRDAEARVLDQLTESQHSYVLATGGSLVTASATYQLLRARCFTVWLSATPEDHMTRVVSQGDMRPMRGREQAMSELRGILAQRESLYRLADVTLDTSRMTREEVVAGIVAELD